MLPTGSGWVVLPALIHVSVEETYISVFCAGVAPVI